MWIYDLATSTLSLDGTVIGKGACTLEAGVYTLGPVADLEAGIPVAGADGGHVAPGGAVDVPADVVARIIASKVTTLAVVAPPSAEPAADGKGVEASPA